jgi:peroxiredoxin
MVLHYRLDYPVQYNRRDVRSKAMSPTIQEQSDQLQAASAGRLPAEVAATFARDRAVLRERGTPTDAVSAGDLLQDFNLPDATGKDVSLSQLVADGPAVLVFYRGGWCPYCNLALHQYQTELVPQLSRFNARMAAISPQAPDESLSTAEKHALQFPVLSDAGARLARQLGVTFQPAEDVLEAQRALGLDIRETNAEGATELPMPTVIVVDRDRIVRFADVHPDYTSRTEVQAIISALADL